MEVIQIPLQDQFRPIDNLRTRTFFIVNDLLDEKVLKDALDRLIRHHWRKLGARVVSKDGRLEYHLPSSFDDNYELYRWSSRIDGRSLDEAAPFLKSPESQQTVSILEPLSSADSLFKPSDWPLERKDDPPDAPMLFVHMTFFSDATVIATSCVHIMMDQSGLANVMNAWMGVIEGKTPPAMVGHDEDVLPHTKSYSDYSKDEISRKGKLRIRRFGEYFFVVLGFIPELLFRKEEGPFMLFFPFALLESLRVRHSQTLEEKHGASPDLSSGDILSAILLKFSRMYHTKSVMMTLSQATNLRNRIPALSGDNASAFLHNSLIFPTSHFRLDPSTPVSEIAYHNRTAIKAVEQEDPEVYLTVIREMVRRNQGLHICEPFGKSYAMTNWAAAWRGLDFGPATKPTQGQERAKPSFLVIGRSTETGVTERFCGTIMSRTEQGIWCSFAASAQAMALVREYLVKDPGLETF